MTIDTHEQEAGGGKAIDTTWDRLRQDEANAGSPDLGGGMIDDPVRRGSIEDDIPQPAVGEDDVNVWDSTQDLPGNDLPRRDLPGSDVETDLPGNDLPDDDLPDAEDDDLDHDLPGNLVPPALA